MAPYRLWSPPPSLLLCSRPGAWLNLGLGIPLLLSSACYQGDPSEAASGPGDSAGSGDSAGPGSTDGNGPDVPPPPPPPELPGVCIGFDPQDISQPNTQIDGDRCNEDDIRTAVEAGGTILLRCPDAPVVFTSQITIDEDTVIDGGGVTILDGGGTTRLLHKLPGPDLHLQNITLQHAQAPEALGNPEVTQANWFQWAGGAILAECHDNDYDVGGGVYGKNLVCRDNATGSHTRDPNTGQILDTGNGGCIYSFTCVFHCDECDLSNNRATNGGAIGTLGGKTRLTHSRCAGNEARFDGSNNDNRGCGGCFCQDGTETAPGEDDVNYLEMCGNVFAGNRSDRSGGAVSLFYRQQTRTRFRFERNDCRNNSAGEAGGLHEGGGCLYVYVDPDTKIPWAPDVGPDSFLVASNTFIENSAEYLGGGAAIYNIWQTEAHLVNNLFLRNDVRTTDQDTGGGGALGLVGTYFSVDHNTFVHNIANNWTGGIQLGAGAIELHNNLFFENYGPLGPGGPPTSATAHVNWNLDESDDGNDAGFLVYKSGGNLYSPSVTEGGEPRPSPGAALIDEDPRLGELSSENSFPPYLPLEMGSPVIDAGEPLDTVTVDMRGEPRTARPDIGAYERASAP